MLGFSTQTRARLSFKRRLPTRQHRRSAAEESGAFPSTLSPCELNSPNENGDQVFDGPAEEAECGQAAGMKAAETTDRDCDKTEDEVAESDPDNRRGPEEKEGRQAERGDLETVEEQQPSEPCPKEQIEGAAEQEEEEMAQEE